jgi:outer membrane protein assembly factor BamD
MQINRIDTDQTPVKNTLAIFESYRKFYPNGPHTSEVGDKIRDCLDKQLQYEIYVARFYQRAGIRPAAIARLELALGAFPVLPHSDELLFCLARTYQESGQKAKSRELLERLLREFPSSTYAPEAHKVVGSL